MRVSVSLSPQRIRWARPGAQAEPVIAVMMPPSQSPWLAHGHAVRAASPTRLPSPLHLLLLRGVPGQRQEHVIE